ncbi:hypothetical protein Pcinc_025773 [Petrolisthes cinctipes]|uniref:Uncharacterized protein n=1 Tax=Petrolisthes cinctipes TaxID=88211 RepID=A0AAE1F8K1_PETCI|nr:hypothetical protein Pcinc_025773 [Petrolisthes cinctipes]
MLLHLPHLSCILPSHPTIFPPPSSKPPQPSHPLPHPSSKLPPPTPKPPFSRPIPPVSYHHHHHPPSPTSPSVAPYPARQYHQCRGIEPRVMEPLHSETGEGGGGALLYAASGTLRYYGIGFGRTGLDLGNVFLVKHQHQEDSRN